MRSEGSHFRLDEIADLNPRRTLSRGQDATYIDMAALPTGAKSIDTTGLQKRAFTSGSKFQNGDTLIARITPCLENGKAAFVDCLGSAEIAAGSTEFIVVSPKDPEDADFVYYLTCLPEFREFAISHMEGTSGRQRVSHHSLARFEFPSDALPTRHAISQTLKSIDDKIANNRALAADLEAMARAIFKSWFVDFDPVKAKMKGCAPAGMDTDTAALFPDELVESELGLIPKGWEVRPIGEIIDSSLGGDWGKDVPEMDHTERCAIVRGTDLSGLAHCDVSSIPVRYVTAKKLSKRQFGPWDIVFEVSGGSKDQSTGRSLLLRPDQIQALGPNSCCASFCRRFRFENDGKAIWMGVFLDKSYRDGLMWRYQVQSTGISNFQTKVFLEKHLVVEPPQPLLDEFAQLVKPMLEASSISENQGLAELRDTLLPRLISGKLCVSDTEATANEIVA